jgi:hypothetical protein
MDTSEHTIVGVFRDHAGADLAVEQLKQAGFSVEQIQTTAYHPAGEETTEALQQDNAPIVPGTGGGSRFVVAVNAEGREQEAVGVMVQNGANNSDLPPGTVLEHGALVSGQGESTNYMARRDTANDPGTNTFFGEVKDERHPGEIDMMDNSNSPHG